MKALADTLFQLQTVLLIAVVIRESQIMQKYKCLVTLEYTVSRTFVHIVRTPLNPTFRTMHK